MDYIQTLQTVEILKCEREGKKRAPLDSRLAKKRALVIYSNGVSNAWKFPLMEKYDNEVLHSLPSKVSVDLTKDDNTTTALTDTISKLTQDLVFSRKNVNESINITNAKRDEENTIFLDKIWNLQKSTDKSIDSLPTFIKGTLKI